MKRIYVGFLSAFFCAGCVCRCHPGPGNRSNHCERSLPVRSVRKNTPPAGTYRVRRAYDDRGTKVLVMTSFENREGVFLLSSDVSTTREYKPAVSFEHIGDQYFLSKIETADHIFTYPVSTKAANQVVAMKKQTAPLRVQQLRRELSAKTNNKRAPSSDFDDGAFCFLRKSIHQARAAAPSSFRTTRRHGGAKDLYRVQHFLVRQSRDAHLERDARYAAENFVHIKDLFPRPSWRRRPVVLQFVESIRISPTRGTTFVQRPFGVIQGAGDPRILQFALKFSF